MTRLTSVLLLAWVLVSCSGADSQQVADNPAQVATETEVQAPGETQAEAWGQPAAGAAEAAQEAAVQSAAPAVEEPAVEVESGPLGEMLAQGAFGQAVKAREETVSRGTLDRKAALELVNLYFRAKELEKAKALLVRVLDVYPEDLDALRYLTRYYVVSGLLEPGLDELKKHADKDPENLEKQSLVLRLMIYSGKQNQAIQQTRELLRKDEVNVELMKILAKAYISLGKYKTAEYILKRARDIRQPDVETLFMMADIAKNTATNKANVVDAFREVVNAQPDNAEAHNNLGLQYYETRNFQNAADEFEKAVSLAPGFYEAKLNLGNAYKALQQYEKARDTYLEVLEEKPGFESAYYNLGIMYFENEVTKDEKKKLLAQSVEYFEQYRKVMGPRLSPQDPVNQYIAEARDLMVQIDRSEKEEADAKAARIAKYEELQPKARERISKLEGIAADLKNRVAVYTKLNDVPKTEQYEGLLNEFTDQYNGSLQALKEAMANKDGDEVQGVLEDFAFADEETLPKLEEALKEPLPEGAAAPAQEPAPAEPETVTPGEPLGNPAAVGSELPNLPPELEEEPAPPVEELPAGEPEAAEATPAEPAVEPAPEAEPEPATEPAIEPEAAPEAVAEPAAEPEVTPEAAPAPAPEGTDDMQQEAVPIDDEAEEL